MRARRPLIILALSGFGTLALAVFAGFRPSPAAHHPELKRSNGFPSVRARSSHQPPLSAKTIEFNRDVRPILANCMTCHGPAAGEGVAGLRLDAFTTATKELPSGRRAIVPGKPEESELMERVESKDEALVMPPASTHKVLSKEDKATLRKWIEEGAEFKAHWAFVTPVRPALPDVKDRSWPRNAIDRYVLANLEAHGLEPENETDRRTLIRRVSLDITGLPPTPEEVRDFLEDRSANAYEKVVDRLLASQRYGERMAMDWMDYARYADSNGYQADYERYQSRWRDWVIDAFNKNMPYDQFTVEQIAGDLLPNATMEQKLATAFNRNHRINTEGGVIAEEWRVETVIDRVETTSAVWLGLTSGCARCHDHKYDPLSQKDFYRLFAYFNNVPESGSGEERPINHPPTMRTPTRQQSQELERLQGLIARLDKKQQESVAKNLARAAHWKLNATLPIVENGLIARYSFTPNASPNPKMSIWTVVGKPTFEPGRATGAVVTNNDSYLDLGEIGKDLERGQAFSFGAWIKPANGEGSPFSRMDSNGAFRGWECSVFQGRPQAHLINMWPQNAIKIAAKQPIPNDKWSHVFMTYDGSSKAAGFKMYINGKPVEVNIENDKLTDTIKTGVSTKIGRRTNSEQFSGAVDDFALFGRVLKPEEVAHLASTHPALSLLKVPFEERSEAQTKEISRLWSLEHDKVFAERDKDLTSNKETLAKLDAAIPSTMVMQEMEKPRDCFVLERGQYDQHGEKVSAGLPDWLPSSPGDAPNNRLGLAKWIVSEENPLTARVTVNRLWERFFGIGIVRTIEDFGTRAEYPSNPQLLDYLATEFVRLDWDLKALIKQIVMSAAYRQSSEISAEKLEADPENRLISRGPRFRLTGEAIRDQALFVSGLLVEKLGGPSVYPYMPEAVWDETNFYGNLRNYQHAKGNGLYRRSLYTIWKRTAAPPNMLLFDVPARETCRVHRARTDTPLQALTLMNDETFVEAARVLAQKAILEGGATPKERLTYAFERVLCRPPTQQELGILTKSLDARIARYRKEPMEAKKLAITGEAPLNPGIDLAELAAYTVSVSAILNLDEAITKQ